MFSTNEDYEILTPHGWVDFMGVLQTQGKELFRIALSDGTHVDATAEHTFFSNGERVQTQALQIGQHLDTTTSQLVVQSIQPIGVGTVYDVVEVKNTDHSFLINGSIITKNCDETAFVRPNIQNEFWASVSPTLATGGKLFITSTPNGDMDLFSTLWRGAISKTNGFAHMTIKWNEVPGRDNKFKEREIKKSGILKWQQEYECFEGHEYLDIQDTDGRVVSLTGEQLYRMLSQIPTGPIDNEDNTPSLAENTLGLKILTVYGFESFGGISYNGIHPTVVISFTDGTSLTTTYDHRLFVNSMEICSKSVKPGMKLDGEQKTVVSITQGCYERMYDIVHTDSHTYLVNGVSSHNCIFVSSEPLLIDSLKAQQLKFKRQKTTNHGIKIWEPFSSDLDSGPLEVAPTPKTRTVYQPLNAFTETPKESKKQRECIITVDPSKGLDGDYTVIEVFSYPELHQMMEFRSNNTKTPDTYRLLKYLWRKAGEANWSVLFTVENNGVGEGIVALYESDEHLPDNVELIVDGSSAQSGMSTTLASKNRACRILKEFVESNKLKINSEQLIAELKTYVKSKSSYAAQPGGTDDCVAATLLVCRVVHAIATYDQNAFQQLYEVGEDLTDDDDDDDEEGGYSSNSDEWDDWDEMPIVI